MCIPSTCSAADTSNGINQMLGTTVLEGMVSVTTQEHKCRTKEPSSFNISDWVAM